MRGLRIDYREAGIGLVNYINQPPASIRGDLTRDAAAPVAGVQADGSPRVTRIPVDLPDPAVHAFGNPDVFSRFFESDPIGNGFPIRIGNFRHSAAGCPSPDMTLAPSFLSRRLNDRYPEALEADVGRGDRAVSTHRQTHRRRPGLKRN